MCKKRWSAATAVLPDLSKFRHFGKILKIVWPFLEKVFSIWQKCEPAWANFLYFWANFYFSKWPNIEEII